MASPYDTDLDRNPANFQPLTPLTLLERAAAVYPDRPAASCCKPRLQPAPPPVAAPSNG